MKKLKKLTRIIQTQGYWRALKSTAGFLRRFIKRNVIYNPILIGSRFFHGNWTTVCNINGSKMMLNFNPKKSHKIERDLFLKGIREPGATKVFIDILQEIEKESQSKVHVFDIGANIGYFVLLEAKILGKKGKIYAIEAEPGNVERLRRNVNLNDYQNVEILQIAAGQEKTKKQLSLRGSSNIHRMTEVLEDKNRIDAVDVDVYPIDHLIKERNIDGKDPIIIRMDVEGYERHVFDGMKDFLSSENPALILFELHPDRKAVDVGYMIRQLKKNGFEPDYISKDGGDTYKKIETFDDIPKLNKNSHILARRNL